MVSHMVSGQMPVQLTGQEGQGAVAAGVTDEEDDDAVVDIDFFAEAVAVDFCADKRLRSPGHSRNWAHG